MSDDHVDDSEVFDIERIRQLIELMKEHDLSEVDLRHAPRRIKLRRGSDPLPMVGYPPVMQAPIAAGNAAATIGDSPAAESGDDANISVIKSPMVGTFYTRPKPESDNYVKVGDHVEADTIVCIVEAMKMFNEIPAGVAGTVRAILVKNEESVDVNKPLFKIATA